MTTVILAIMVRLWVAVLCAGVACSICFVLGMVVVKHAPEFDDEERPVRR